MYPAIWHGIGFRMGLHDRSQPVFVSAVSDRLRKRQLEFAAGPEADVRFLLLLRPAADLHLKILKEI